MPGTGNPPITSNNSILQRCAVMATPRREGVNLIVKLDEEDFSIWDTLDLKLGFIKGVEGSKGGNVL